MPRMLRRLLAVSLLAGLLVLGQQGAAMHAVTHVTDWQEHEDQSPHGTTSCEQCVVYAKFASALPTILHGLTLSQTPQEAVEHPVHVALSFLPSAYSARAPPFHA